MDIAVAGAGIAGLTLAILLKREGHQVLLYDQLEALAPVGSGLIIQPTGQFVLEQMGLLDEVVRKGAQLDGLYGTSAQTGRAALNVSYDALRPSAFGLGIHRATLFSLLLATAKTSGVQFEKGRRIASVKRQENGIKLIFDDGDGAPMADLVVDAMGVKSPLADHSESYLRFGALWTNVPWSTCAGFSRRLLSQKYSHADKMAGILPIGEGPNGEQQAAFFWSLKASDFDKWRSTNLDEWKSDVVDLWPEAEQVLSSITSKDEIVFARYAHHTNKNPIQDRLVHIGDSWHAASPQLGQGANMAMLDALALSKALKNSPDIESVQSAYLSARRNHIRIYQLISLIFTPFYQSTSRVLPVVRDVIGPFSALPGFNRMLALMVSGELALSLKATSLKAHGDA